MTTEEAVKRSKKEFSRKSKFDMYLKELLLVHKDKEYSEKLFKKCFDKALTKYKVNE